MKNKTKQFIGLILSVMGIILFFLPIFYKFRFMGYLAILGLILFLFGIYLVFKDKKYLEKK